MLLHVWLCSMPSSGLGERLAGVQGQTDGEALTEEFMRWCVGEARFDRHPARFRKCIAFLVSNWSAIAGALCRLGSAALEYYNRHFHGGLALTSTEEPLSPSPPPAQPHRSEPLACSIDMPYANNDSQKQSRLSLKGRMQLLKQRVAKQFSTRCSGMSSNGPIVAV